MDICRINMIGRIAVVREGKTAKGTFVANLRLAVNDDKNKATFWSVAIWGAYGQSLFHHLRVGERIAVDGRLAQDQSGGAFISVGRGGMVELLTTKAESQRLEANRASRAAAAEPKAKAPKPDTPKANKAKTKVAKTKAAVETGDGDIPF